MALFNTSEKYNDIINGIAFGLFSVFWWALVVATIIRLDDYDARALIRIGSILAVSLGVYVAIWVHYSNTLWRRSETYLQKCEEFLEKAYNTFTKTLDSEGRPPNNRMVWLNTARLLQTCIDLSKKISDKGHMESYIAVEQYWRGMFYDILITNQDLFPENYFAGNPETFLVHGHNDQEPLAELSLVAIYGFVRWPEYANDPLLKLSNFSNSEVERLRTFGPRGLGALIHKVNNIRRPEHQ